MSQAPGGSSWRDKTGGPHKQRSGQVLFSPAVSLAPQKIRNTPQNPVPTFYLHTSQLNASFAYAFTKSFYIHNTSGTGNPTQQPNPTRAKLPPPRQPQQVCLYRRPIIEPDWRDTKDIGQSYRTEDRQTEFHIETYVAPRTIPSTHYPHRARQRANQSQSKSPDLFA